MKRDWSDLSLTEMLSTYADHAEECWSHPKWSGTDTGECTCWVRYALAKAQALEHKPMSMVDALVQARSETHASSARFRETGISAYGTSPCWARPVSWRGMCLAFSWYDGAFSLAPSNRRLPALIPYGFDEEWEVVMPNQVIEGG